MTETVVVINSSTRKGCFTKKEKEKKKEKKKKKI